jgi:hypothetical protein
MGCITIKNCSTKRIDCDLESNLWTHIGIEIGYRMYSIYERSRLLEIKKSTLVIKKSSDTLTESSELIVADRYSCSFFYEEKTQKYHDKE